MTIFVDTNIVSLRVSLGHFATSHTSEKWWVEAAIPHRGGEAADRRGNAGTWRFGRACGASARGERQPSLWLASAISARTAGKEREGGAEPTPGPGNERRCDASSRVFAYSPDRKGEHPQAHLSRFTGTLQADAYAEFDPLYESGKILLPQSFPMEGGHILRPLTTSNVRTPI